MTKVNDETVDPRELGDIVSEACAARNGWKVILRRCSPTKPAAPSLTVRSTS